MKTEVKTCLDHVLDIAHDSTNQDSRTYKLPKREVNFSEVQSIEIKLQLIENSSQGFSAEISISVQTLPKMFRVLSGTLLGIKG